MVINLCQGSTKALRNHLKAHHKKEYFLMICPWKHHESQFPLIAKIVKVVFPVPAASSKSERVFSVRQYVVTPKRAKLNPEEVEDLVVVKCNLRLLKTMGFRK